MTILQSFFYEFSFKNNNMIQNKKLSSSFKSKFQTKVKHNSRNKIYFLKIELWWQLSWMVDSNDMRLTIILNCANERCMHNMNVCTGLNKTTQSKLTNPWLINSDLGMEIRSYEVITRHDTYEMLVNHTNKFVQMNGCNQMNADNLNTYEWS